MSGHDGEDSPPEADSDEKTAALSLEDMGLEDDEGEATAAISLEDLGLDFDAPASPPSEAPPEDSAEDEDTEDKTAAFSLEDMGIAPEAPPAQPQVDETPEENAEGEDTEDKTAAFSLEDMGITPEAPPAPPQVEETPEDSAEDEDTEDKTAAFSLEDMGIAPEAPPAPPQAEAPPEDDEDTEDKTAAFSLEDMGIAPEVPPAPPQVEETPEDSAEDEDTEDKTAAFSLEDMGIAPEVPPAPPQVEAPATDVQEERTAALSLEDMGVAQLDSLQEEEDEEEETEAMPPARPPQTPPPNEDEERTAAMSLEDMGVASADPDDERTAAMSIADMGLEDAPPPPELEIRNGNDRGQSFVIAGASQTVGRGLDCDVVLNDASVSRKHFRLDKTASGYRMIDLGSGNGTKINGVRLSEFDLAHGTIIEAGTTTMAWKQLDKPAAAKEFKEGWDDNAESTRVSDLAAISVLPEWKEQVQKEEQAKVVAAQRGPLKMIVMLLSIIIALMLGFMGLDKALNMGIVFDDGTAAEADLAAAEAKREAIELMNAGKEAFTEREWSKARKKFKAALKLDEDVREGKRYLDKTKDEAAAFKALRRGRAALDDEQYAEAVEELSTINDASLYYSEDGEGGEGAVDLLNQAIDSFVEAKLLDSQRLDEEGDAAGALAAIEAALKLAPEDASALALKAELSEDAEGDAEPQAKPSTATATAERPARSTSKSAPRTKRAETPQREAKAAPEKVEKASRAEKTETTSSSSRASAKTSTRSAKKKKKKKKSAGMLVALSNYASGDFSGAISELKNLSKRGSRKAKAKAKRLASAVENFKGLYVPAMAAAKSFRSPTKTIKSLRAARKLDASISGAYSKRIRKELARQLAFQANQAWSSKKFGKAGRHARQALALDPQLTQAKKIYTEVQAEAQGWFDQAKAAASSNPDKAMQLLSRVVSIFPRGDQRYKEAYKLLNQLAAEEED